VASNSDDESSGVGLDRGLEQIFGRLPKLELERLTIDAIRDYRASVAIAEAARLVRVAAEVDGNSCPQRRAELQKIHENAEADHRARQLVLNNLIDRLGYVPKVPSG
jgi:hypothetical protein